MLKPMEEYDGQFLGLVAEELEQGAGWSTPPQWANKPVKAKVVGSPLTVSRVGFRGRSGAEDFSFLPRL